MDASKQHWRRAAQNSVKFILSIIFLTAAFLAITLGVPALKQAGWNGHALSGGALIADIRNYLRNPIAYFATRSPGARGSGRLIQSKHRMFRLAGTRTRPHERVLSGVRNHPPVPSFLNDLLPNGSPVEPDEAFPAFHSGSPILPSSQPIVPVVVPGTGGGGGGPGGNGGGGGNTAVPEPATWLTLIWGMTLVGFGLRSNRRREVRAVLKR